MAQKKIQFAHKMTHHRINVIEAVAWVTAKQPSRAWKSEDVTRDIGEALSTDGFFTDGTKVRNAVKWLHAEGYGVVTMQGQRFREFILDPDLVLSRPAYVKAKDMKAKAEAKIDSTIAKYTSGSAPKVIPSAVSNGATPAKTSLMTLPLPPGNVPGWLPSLDILLTNYWKDEPEEATAWAQKVIDMLTERGIQKS